MPSVLLVEDNELILKSLEHVLAKDGFDVVAVKDGEEAMRAVAMFNYDVVITDINMPNINGLDLIQRLKASEATSNVGIIVVSSLVNESSVLEALRLGADLFLPKPIKPYDLVLRVKKLVAEKMD
ncbi:response regulator [Flavipsychrobacter stenotrophus]|uniref:Response regulator n=1 Tax=Flavipsychrobacter stenotrophus TaxID=2077091 RepID=A0A2S7SU60_9BACT|nr:response regulator [Flavipsychrobacter stenotrophus]PQJ10135.1 response regulator [Flavipsychrobacter stenotrophus]